MTFARRTTTAATADDRWSFSVTLVAAFLLLLPIVLIAQVLTLHWRSWLPGAEGEQSLIGGVKASVYTFLALV
ncbi:hypothetical protein [Aquabacterium sp.]|uniref:hypothetical protein n=1 Tax=Aquabacterium sp. TaxID=1872578 RepID=UPI0037840180